MVIEVYQPHQPTHLNQVHVAEKHASAAVALQIEGVQRVSLLNNEKGVVTSAFAPPPKYQPYRVVLLEELEVGVPLVADDLSAGEAADGDDLKGVLVII